MLGQSTHYVIQGVVRDAVTEETLPFANVFLTGTTYGTVTGTEGKFQLKVFERGTYELVVSFVGYQTYSTRVEFLVPETQAFDIKLTQDAVNLGSVLVTDRDDKEWRRNLASFKRVFLGLTKNAQKCKILNEEEINFYYDKEKRTLEAFCTEPILVKNDALGYSLDYYLESFIIDYRNGYSSFFGFTQFKETKPRNATKKKFIKSRDRAFYGSTEHFFRSLSINSLKDEGWEVMLAEDVYGFGRVVKALDYDVYKDLKEGPTDISKSISFEGYMYVTYLNELESDEYMVSKRAITVGGNKLSRNPQRSWIRIIEQDGDISFESSGYVLNPLAFFSDGYWGFEKVSDMLPSNFQPSSK